MSAWLQVTDRATLEAAPMATPMEQDPGYLVQVSGMATPTKKPVSRDHSLHPPLHTP